VGTAAAAGAVNGEGGARKCEMVRWAGAGGAGVLTCALACLGHTRRGSGDARRPLASTQRADTDAGRPLSCVAQFVRNRDGRLTTGFQSDLTAKP